VEFYGYCTFGYFPDVPSINVHGIRVYQKKKNIIIEAKIEYGRIKQ